MLGRGRRRTWCGTSVSWCYKGHAVEPKLCVVLQMKKGLMVKDKKRGIVSGMLNNIRWPKKRRTCDIHERRTSKGKGLHARGFGATLHQRAKARQGPQPACLIRSPAIPPPQILQPNPIHRLKIPATLHRLGSKFAPLGPEIPFSASDSEANSVSLLSELIANGVPRPRDPAQFFTLCRIRIEPELPIRGAPNAGRRERIEYIKLARRGVDAIRRWIAASSGPRRATAAVRTRSLPLRRRSHGLRRQGASTPRKTPLPASARRCCRGSCLEAWRGRAARCPAAVCSGKIGMAASSPMSGSSSLVTQATQMMSIWIHAYAQSCKYILHRFIPTDSGCPLDARKRILQ